METVETSAGERARVLLARLFEPLCIAAYVTWAAVFADVWQSDPARLLAWPGLSVAIMLGFLGLFIATHFSAEGSFAKRALLVGQIVLALALLPAVRAYSSPILLTIAMAQVPTVLPHRWVVFVAANAVVYFVADVVWQSDRPLLTTVLYGTFQMFAMLTASYAARAEAASAQLREVNAHLLATRSLLEASARDAERLRLARELHDVAGHKLTALKLNLVALSRDTSLRDRTELETSVGLADELLCDIRGVVRQMRLHDGVELSEALRQIAAPFPRPRIALDIEPGLKVDDVTQAEALVRTAQEALTNAARHSDAAHVDLRLRHVEGGVALDVVDDGRGARTLEVGHGLRGMRERIEAVGGTLTFGDARGDGGGSRGFAVRAFLPARGLA